MMSAMNPPAPSFAVNRGVRGNVHSFQVYLEPTRVVFIRLGMGPGAEYAAGVQGGLVGGLLMWWISSARKKREQRRAEENRTKTVDEMLADHKVNQAIPLSDFSDVSLEPGGWALKKGTVKWLFQLPGEKKRTLCVFRTPEDVRAGVEVLPQLFPGIRVAVELDPRSGKYLKKKA